MSKNANKIKSEFLGMPMGTAWARLRKRINVPVDPTAR